MKNRKNARVPELRLRGYDALSFVAQLPSCYVFAFNYITSLILCEPRIETTVLETLDLEVVKKLMSHE